MGSDRDLHDMEYRNHPFRNWALSNGLEIFPNVNSKGGKTISLKDIQKEPDVVAAYKRGEFESFNRGLPQGGVDGVAN